jgi:hypothetical protein
VNNTKTAPVTRYPNSSTLNIQSTHPKTDHLVNN